MIYIINNMEDISSWKRTSAAIVLTQTSIGRASKASKHHLEQFFIDMYMLNSSDIMSFLIPEFSSDDIPYLTTLLIFHLSRLMKNQQNDCAPSKDLDQPGHHPSLIRVFAVRTKKAWVLSYPLSGCPSWSESALSAVILLVLSWGGSSVQCENTRFLSKNEHFSIYLHASHILQDNHL